MGLSAGDWQALWLTARLAATVTALLLVLGTPLAWWLARSRSLWKRPVAALVALPLVLPPTVIGFYLLLAMGPQGPLGHLATLSGLAPLAFSFPGLVLASLVYSLPFTVQPLQAAFEGIGERPLEAAATLRASPLDAFLTVALPLARSGYLTAAGADLRPYRGRVRRGADDRRQHPRRDRGSADIRAKMTRRTKIHPQDQQVSRYFLVTAQAARASSISYGSGIASTSIR